MTGAPRKVLVMELAGLGDNVHLLPGLWEVRAHWRAAELHVMVNAPMAPLFNLTPWVDRTWRYPTAPKPGLRGTLALARTLRAQGFDCVINTTGSDRSSILTWATGAARRIARRPADGGPPGWSRLMTRVVAEPHYRDPMFVQKRRVLRAALGLAPADEPGAPDFHVEIDARLRREAGIEASDERTYAHVSPFTTSPARELPLAQLADLLARLTLARPALRVALSCSPDPRETARLGELVARLAAPPWKVFAGTLAVDGLAAVIAGAALNLSGDTGSLHLAYMARTPAVAWFRAHRGQDEWIPREGPYRVIVAEGGAPDALHGIDTQALAQAALALLEGRAP